MSISPTEVPEDVLRKLVNLAQSVIPQALDWNSKFPEVQLLCEASLWIPHVVAELLSQRRRVLQVSGERCPHHLAFHTIHPLRDRELHDFRMDRENVAKNFAPNRNQLVTCYVCGAVWVEKR